MLLGLGRTEGRGLGGEFQRYVCAKIWRRAIYKLLSSCVSLVRRGSCWTLWLYMRANNKRDCFMKGLRPRKIGENWKVSARVSNAFSLRHSETSNRNGWGRSACWLIREIVNSGLSSRSTLILRRFTSDVQRRRSPESTSDTHTHRLL